MTVLCTTYTVIVYGTTIVCGKGGERERREGGRLIIIVSESVYTHAPELAAYIRRSGSGEMGKGEGKSACSSTVQYVLPPLCLLLAQIGLGELEEGGRKGNAYLDIREQSRERERENANLLFFLFYLSPLLLPPPSLSRLPSSFSFLPSFFPRSCQWESLCEAWYGGISPTYYGRRRCPCRTRGDGRLPYQINQQKQRERERFTVLYPWVYDKWHS